MEEVGILEIKKKFLEKKMLIKNALEILHLKRNILKKIIEAI